MQKFFQTGYAFFLVAAIFVVVSALTERAGAFLSLAVVFFVLGLAVRKKSSRKPSEPTPKQ